MWLQSDRVMITVLINILKQVSGMEIQNLTNLIFVKVDQHICGYLCFN